MKTNTTDEYLTTDTLEGFKAVLTAAHFTVNKIYIKHMGIEWAPMLMFKPPDLMALIVENVASGATSFGIVNPDYIDPKPRPQAGQIWIARDDVDQVSRRVIVYRVDGETVDALYKRSSSRHSEDMNTWTDLPIENLVKYVGVNVSLASYVARIDEVVL